MPLRLEVPPDASIELWDSGLPVVAHAGDTLQMLAAAYRVPLWALTQDQSGSHARSNLLHAALGAASDQSGIAIRCSEGRRTDYHPAPSRAYADTNPGLKLPADRTLIATPGKAGCD